MLKKIGRWFGRDRRGRAGLPPAEAASRTRICRIDQLEKREFLAAAAPLHVGAVYYEDNVQQDNGGDVFTVTFNGGAADTQLTRLTINLDKNGNGQIDSGEAFCHTAPSAIGVYGYAAPTILEKTGIATVNVTAENNSQLITIDATGFHAGDKLVFSLDVDEMDPEGGTALVEGGEFAGAIMTASFTAPHYADAQGSDTFVDYFDSKLTGTGLNLPPDSYVPPATINSPVLTAGAVSTIQQQPLPASLSGVVFEDVNMEKKYAPTDPPISGVTLTLYELVNGQYVTTGRTAVTDQNGAYSFLNILPGTYEVIETQPTGWYSTCAIAGTVNGVTRGIVVDENTISQIGLEGGDNSIRNDFGEVKPSTLSGMVFVDVNANHAYDSGVDTPLPDVVMTLKDSQGSTVATTTTNAQGQYQFTNLWPNTYTVSEGTTPGYLEWTNYVGTVNGVTTGNLVDPDMIANITMKSGSVGVQYNFSEVVPADLSGYAYVDKNNSGVFEPGIDPVIPNVPMTLRNAQGVVIATTTTNAAGYYQFVSLTPGTYAVYETEPGGYLRGPINPGTLGGVADVPNDAIVTIPVQGGNHGLQYNFGEIEKIPPVPPPEPRPEPPFLPPATGIPGGEPIFIPHYYPIVVGGGTQVLLGGGGIPMGNTWHLSVINGGQPRNINGGHDVSDAQAGIFQQAASWSRNNLRQGRWVLANRDGKILRRLTFGLPNARPVVGDWNGDGAFEIGVFRDGQWFLDLNGDGTWDDGDLWARLGTEADLPVTGDWDGDGKTDIGIYGLAWAGDHRALAREPGQASPHNPLTNGHDKNIPPDMNNATSDFRTLKRTAGGRLRADVIDHVFRFGMEGDVPVTGDWTGSGVATIGVFHDGMWYLDIDGDGKWSDADVAVKFGEAGDIPVVGDWTGDGIKKLGVYRKGTWILDVNNNRQIDANDVRIQLGTENDIPVVGDWTGDGIDKPGLYTEGAGSDDAPRSAGTDVIRE